MARNALTDAKLIYLKEILAEGGFCRRGIVSEHLEKQV